MDSPTKRCSKCGRELPATRDFFGARSDSKDRLRGACLVCEKQRVAEFRHRDPERAREISRRSYEKNREKESLRKKLYTENNYEKERERAARYRREHGDAVRETSRRYYWKTKEQRREHRRKQQAEYRERNRDELKRRQAEWRERNREQLRETYYRDYHDNPDRARVGKAVRRARELAVGGSFSAQDVRDMYSGQRGRCWWCGKPVGRAYHVDHRIPLARGGSNAPDNLCISCPKCNRVKGAKMPWEFNGRLL